jgi:hypothetical protein
MNGHSDIPTRHKCSDVPFKIVTLCVCLLALTPGVISLVLGLHRVPLSTTCMAGGVVCYLAADISRRQWMTLVARPLFIGALVAFCFGVR